MSGLNEVLEITALDEQGPGGAHHEYAIRWPVDKKIHADWAAVIGDKTGIAFRFQNGPIKEVGINGVSNEALLAIVIDRLTDFQAGPYACDENEDALVHCVCALDSLKNRTRNRTERGVEGTMQK